MLRFCFVLQEGQMLRLICFAGGSNLKVNLFCRRAKC